MTSKAYNNGLHILLTLAVDDIVLLTNFAKFDVYISEVLKTYETEVVGKTHFEFPNKSYTAVYCLKESHLAIHTWPEFKKINFDLFLCNYSKDNTRITGFISEKVVQYFHAKILQQEKIYRL